MWLEVKEKVARGYQRDITAIKTEKNLFLMKILKILKV